MAGDVGDLVATMDPTIGIDEVTVTHRVLGILLAGSTSDFVRRPDGAIHIAQQTERKVLRFGEREIVGRRVERSAEDDGIELFKSLGTVTQALTLDRSTRCRRFRVPPQQHPLPAKTLEVNVVAVLVGQFKIRRNRVQRQHCQSLADLDGVVTDRRSSSSQVGAGRSPERGPPRNEHRQVGDHDRRHDENGERRPRGHPDGDHVEVAC